MRSDLRARLDAYAHGECDYEALMAGLKEICKVNADAVWELLSLLDQYRRRSILTDEDFRRLKNAANYIAFGPPPDAGKSAPSAAKPGRTPQAAATGGSAPFAANEWRLAEDLTEEELHEASLANSNAVSRGFDGRHTSVTATQSARPGREPMPSRAVHAPSGAPLQPGRVLHDRYTIESALAFGHRSAVFRALDRFSISDAERPVAIKALLGADSPQASVEFERELRIGQQLAHPNIVKVFDLDRDDDLLFYSMELIEGAALGELLRHTPPQRPQASSIINQIADALSYMHERGFVHGDLHPGNILISNTGQVKLVDFGAAAGPASAHAPATAVTGANSSSGLSYASCERLAGAASHRRDDVFSLSCIAYQLLGGTHPFRGQTAARARELQQSPVPLRDLAPRQWRCLQHGLAWQREQRPASAREWWVAFKGGNAPVLATRTAAAAPVHTTVVYAAHEETAPRARITAGSRIGAPLAADSQSASRHSSTWPVAITLSLLAVLAFAFLSVDLDSAAVPKLVQAQTSMRQVINQTIDKGLDALRSVGGGTAIRPSASPSATQAPDNTATNASEPDADSDEAPITGALSDTSGAPDRAAASEQPVVPDDHNAAQPAESAARSGSSKPAVADQVGTARGRITLAQDTYVVNKQDGAARIRIKREGGAAGKVTFMWWTEPGTAEIGRDYMSLGRKTETLANGEREITVFVPLVVGSDNHNRHVFFVELGNPSDGLRSGRITRARVIIMDG